MTPLQHAPRPHPEGAGAPATAAERLLREGVAAAGRGAAEEAVACFRQALAAHPGLAAANANLGLLLVALGRPAQAEAPLRAAVAAMPADARLRNALGIAQEGQQRHAEAQASYRAALALDPALAEAHANLGNVLRREGNGLAAQAHLQRAIELAPGFATAHFNLGVVLQDRDEIEPAMAAYRAALARRPDYVEALNNLGSCLRTLGFVDEARATFERILALQPLQLEAHCNLAPFKTYAPDDPHIDQLLSQSHRVPALPADGQVRYWFTAGKMLEDAGRHDESYAAYARANREKRAATPWNEAAHQALQRRIAATFTREALAGPAAPHVGAGPVPVFIVGMPRSGTSLLEQVLATLPGVHGAGELTWLPEALHEAGADPTPAAAGDFPQSLAGFGPARLAAIGERYRSRLRQLAPAATHVVDKLPDNFQHLGLIHRLFPDARIVHAMRDPMDACFSCFSRLFIGDNLAFTYDLGDVGRYWVGYHELMRHWHAVLPAGRILDVSYEAMVADVETQARRLVDYLGLPWDARCLAFHDNRRVVKTASVAQVRRPIYGTSVARWKPYERHLGTLLALVGRYR